MPGHEEEVSKTKIFKDIFYESLLKFSLSELYTNNTQKSIFSTMKIFGIKSQKSCQKSWKNIKKMTSLAARRETENVFFNYHQLSVHSNQSHWQGLSTICKETVDFIYGNQLERCNLFCL